MGADTVLVEKGLMGGDCLNYGCVPSKALIAAARAAQAIRGASRFGVDGVGPRVDFARVHRHVHDVIAGIAPHDSVERFRGLGVNVLRGAAAFVGAGEVVVGDHRIGARRFVIATGSSPAIPPIPGLADVDFLTNETVFESPDLPRRLLVVGGGPIGLELAQAFRRLGAEVAVFEMMRPLAADDPELTGVVVDRLRREGIAIHEHARVGRVERSPGGCASSPKPVTARSWTRAAIC